MVSNRLPLITAAAALASSLLLFTQSTSAQTTGSTSVTPSAPGPGEIFTAGGQCSTTWAPASSDRWSNMTIELMTGSNQQMTSLAVIASGIDGTSSAQTTFTYTCPQVTLYSTVYFYQFSRGNGRDPTWTTRFLIQSPDGESVDPPFTEQASGTTVYWGIGGLAQGSSIPSGSLAAAQGTNAGTTTVTATGPAVATDTGVSASSSTEDQSSASTDGSTRMTTTTSAEPTTSETSSAPTATSTSTSGASAQVGKAGAAALLVVGGALAIML